MLIVDGFAGGGASSGIELALGVSPNIAITLLKTLERWA